MRIADPPGFPQGQVGTQGQRIDGIMLIRCQGSNSLVEDTVHLVARHLRRLGPRPTRYGKQIQQYDPDLSHVRGVSPYGKVKQTPAFPAYRSSGLSRWRLYVTSRLFR